MRRKAREPKETGDILRILKNSIAIPPSAIPLYSSNFFTPISFDRHNIPVRAA